MTKTIVRLFDSREDAMDAVRELERLGVDRDDVSVVANNRERWFDKEHGGERSFAPTERKDTDQDGRDDRAEGAAKGATTGGAIGAGAGLLAGLGMLAIPGLGPVVAAGWLASTAVGALAGAAVGGATGGLIGALTKEGVSEEDAHVYAEGVRRGGVLLSVRAPDDRAAEVESLLDRRRGVAASARGRDYREAGWTRFDPDAPEWDDAQIARERARYMDRPGGAAPI